MLQKLVKDLVKTLAMSRRRVPIPERLQGRITKFYVTNLPDKCSGLDLSEYVRKHGEIYDLYIARKRDKDGNRFGFISLLDVKDKEEMVKTLSSIRMGDYRLKVNVALFALEDGGINQNPNVTKKKEATGGYEKKASHQGVNWGNMYNAGGRPFKEMLTGRKEVINNERLVHVDDGINVYEGLHGRALIARMIDLDALKNINLILNDISDCEGKVQYLGGLSVLITFDSKEEADLVLQATKEVLGRLSSVDLWEGQSIPFERLAWLKIQGIPLHLLNGGVISKIGEAVGKVVEIGKVRV